MGQGTRVSCGAAWTAASVLSRVRPRTREACSQGSRGSITMKSPALAPVSADLADDLEDAWQSRDGEVTHAPPPRPSPRPRAPRPPTGTGRSERAAGRIPHAARGASSPYGCLRVQRIGRSGGGPYDSGNDRHTPARRLRGAQLTHCHERSGGVTASHPAIPVPSGRASVHARTTHDAPRGRGLLRLVASVGTRVSDARARRSNRVLERCRDREDRFGSPPTAPPPIPRSSRDPRRLEGHPPDDCTVESREQTSHGWTPSLHMLGCGQVIADQSL